MVKITLDGKPTEARDGATVLEVAREAGVDIPSLCHHEALGPYGACRLCLVEAEGPTLRRSLVTACTLQASSGLSVDTGSVAVRRARKVVFELLLGRCRTSETLRAMARRHGVEATRFGADVEEDPCVRCGLCVRVCRDKIGTSAIAFASRGQHRRVTAEFGKPSDLCIGCGSCAAICPTGAIRAEDVGDERTIVLKDRVIARFTMVRCGACGAPFATRKLLDAVASRVRDLPEADVEVDCPGCRRVRRAEALAGEVPA